MKPRSKPTLFFFSLVMTSLILAVCFPMLVHAAPPVAAQGIRGEDRESAPSVAAPSVAAPSVAAREAPQAVHLAYLQCYPLGKTAKKACQDKIRMPLLQNLPKQARQNFIYEAERLGFAAFLRQQGKACKTVQEGPKFSEKHKAYIVQCTDNSGTRPTGTNPLSYLMRFDGRAWSLLN